MAADAAGEVLEAEAAVREEELRLAGEAALRRVEVEGLRKRLSVFTSSGTCTACGSPLPAERRAELESALAVAECPVADPSVVLAELRERVDSAREEHRLLRLRVEAADRELSVAHATQRQREAAERTRAEAERAHGEAVERVAGGSAELRRMSLEVAELEAAERVLGLRGVRAAVLGDALSGLGQVANTWLARLGMPELHLSLAATSTRVTGAVVDAISVEVEGAADGQGYQGASGGERTRFDLALMLALADVAGGLNAGGAGGTLWFDEVLDTLDASGVEAVVALLEELSAERPVVVISHAVDLIERLHPSAVLRLRVEDGSVRTA
jgi:DNA repair exonuclease SbcCD ATPase subunit